MITDRAIDELGITKTCPFAKWLRSLQPSSVVIDLVEYCVICGNRTIFIYDEAALGEIWEWLFEHGWTATDYDAEEPSITGFSPPSPNSEMLFKLRFSNIFEHCS